MSGGFDMHIHSAASDGKLSPSEIMSVAINSGLDGFAITDHDTVAALAEAQAVADEKDFPFIPGIEISAEYERQDIHILGYWIDYRYLTDSGFLIKVQEAREERFWRIAKRLRALGMPLDAEKIMESLPPGSSLGRPHIAQAMMDAGYVISLREAFLKWLGRGLPAYVPRLKISPFDAMNIIHEAGGVAVLAHPGTGVQDYLIPYLVKKGLAGIEAYHPEHTRQAEKKYANIAHRYKLAAMGGSDFHREGVRMIGCRRTSLGQLAILASHKSFYKD